MCARYVRDDRTNRSCPKTIKDIPPKYDLVGEFVALSWLPLRKKIGLHANKIDGIA